MIGCCALTTINNAIAVQILKFNITGAEHKIAALQFLLAGHIRSITCDVAFAIVCKVFLREQTVCFKTPDVTNTLA